MTRRIALVHNPTKPADAAAFVDLVAARVQAAGDEFLGAFPTTADDPGQDTTRELVRQVPDLILAAGGDGTIRSVTSGLVNTGVACAIIPMGTGNLMARNLGVPLEIPEALDVALTCPTSPMDAVQLIVDGDHDHPVWFTGMAGVGFDAAMMRDTHDELKKIIGTGAYVLAFARNIASPPHRVSIQIDGRSPIRRRPVLVMVGNTHSLQGNLVLFPDATPDDGIIDLVTATPYIPGTWWRVLGTLLRARYARHRQRAESRAVQFDKGRRITLEFNSRMPWEVDGDTMGTGQRFQFTVAPGALRLVTPLDDLRLPRAR